MDKKIISIFIVSSLFIFFSVICMIIYFSKSPKPVLIRRKMKTGALLISILAIASSCNSGEEKVTCYDTATVPDSIIDIEVQQVEDSNVTITSDIN
jgi:hypothetical protein